LSKAKPTIGSAAPVFALEAVVSKRQVGPAAAAGTPLLLLFQTHESVDPARHLIVTVRRRYPDPDALLIANVVDLRQVPKLLRGMAMSIMANAYKEASESLPPEVDPVDHLIFAPDWRGNVLRAYGFSDVSEQIGAALIDADGRLYDTAQGRDLLSEIFDWLENLSLR
jgi:hypothetical protein